MSSHEHDAMETDKAPVTDKAPDKEHGHGHSHDHADGHQAAKIVAIATVTLGGATFAIDREG